MTLPLANHLKNMKQRKPYLYHNSGPRRRKLDHTPRASAPAFSFITALASVACGTIFHNFRTTSGNSDRRKHDFPFFDRAAVLAGGAATTPIHFPRPPHFPILTPVLPPSPPASLLLPPAAPGSGHGGEGGGTAVRSTKWLGSRLSTTKRSSSPKPSPSSTLPVAKTR